MRTVIYVVKAFNGQMFTTTSYAIATENGNRIVQTRLEKVDEKTPEQKAYAKWHAGKIHEILFGE